jgi:hypothetical protein
MRLLKLPAGNILGKNREAVGSNDSANAAAFEVIEAHSFYGRLGFTASHEGFKRVIGEAA